jgi:hypothetical protein
MISLMQLKKPAAPALALLHAILQTPPNGRL